MNAPLPRLLIVDDEEQIRRLIMEFLEDYEEFDLRDAGSGEEALDVLAQGRADLCVVDMRLPGMRGEEFILEAKARGLCDHFFLHTGSVDLTLSDALREIGLTDDDVFIKPNDLERLVERIREVLQSPAG